MSKRFLVNIKSETGEEHEKDYNFDNESSCTENYNSDLIEDVNTNKKILYDIGQFIAHRNEIKNKKNLINYCGILDPTSETDGCARVNSIYVAKFGKSHIKSERFLCWILKNL